MNPIRSRHFALLWVLAVLLAGCGARTRDTSGDQSAAPPGDDPAMSQELPAGHPPVGGAPTNPDLAIIPPPAGSGQGSTGLTWVVPSGWVEEQPRSEMRRAQYRIPGEAGDAEFVVFYFGPGQGGDATSNIERWAEQFVQPDGSSSLEALTKEEISVDGTPVLLSEVTGTYSGGMAMMGGPSENLAGYMLLGAVAEGPDANWFFKLTGPEATVENNRDAFRGLIDSLSVGS